MVVIAIMMFIVMMIEIKIIKKSVMK